MMILVMKLILTILLAAVASAAADVQRRDQGDFEVGSPPVEGYDLVPMAWTGVIEKGGPEMTFNGSIEQVTTQIQAVNPAFTWDALLADLGYDNENDTVSEHQPSPVEKRDAREILCGVGGVPNHWTWKSDAQEMQRNLAKNPGQCSAPGGPRACSIIIGGHRNARVWLCNDNAEGLSRPCADLANFVQDIIGRCRYWDDNRPGWWHRERTRGQEFDAANFNVIVGAYK
ncbi:hypothetical protein F4778DRAFT_783908 [Xylariomycetidae sp. FL2044]|nr:hypothetical protein F4778DRAFT_783908 [Xylariomycetidae sp. FL2044]